MSGPPSYDNDLLARLNKLKPSSISSLEPQKPTLSIINDIHSPEDGLSARLKLLRNTSNKDGIEPSPKQDREGGAIKKSPASDITSLYTSPDVSFDETGGLPSILRPSNPTSTWEIPRIDPSEASSLSQRADELLARMQKHQIASTTRQKTSTASRRPEHVENDEAEDDGGYRSDSTDLEAEAREAEELLAELIDEAALEHEEAVRAEKENPKPQVSARQPATTSSESTAQIKHDTLSLPSAPMQLKDHFESEPSVTDDFESSIAARMAALNMPQTDSLGLPSAPTTLPSKAAAGPIDPPKPVEPEDWCCVCYDTGTIICYDCDEAFYCARCWKEGHGDAEARMHEWDKYRRPR